MARLESVMHHHHLPIRENHGITWVASTISPKTMQLPQIFWSDGRPWREANLWIHERAIQDHKNSATVLAGATALFAYAKWLEKTQTHWWDFPERKKDRCLIRYRGDLVLEREEGRLAPSTVSERMRVVIVFYRWLKARGLLSTTWPLWNDRVVRLKWADHFGMERTMSALSSELSIPNRSLPGDGPEQRLMPVSTEDRDIFLRFVKENASEELFLFLSLGFFTGMRLGSLADLRLGTLTTAIPDPRCADLLRITLGPGARPPVSTKFGVTGIAFIPRILLEQVMAYASSPRRLLRQAKADQKNSDLVFLTKYGNRYAERGLNKSVAINVEMWSVKKKATGAGIQMAKDFRFHQSRATFGTELARLALRYCGAQEAVGIVMEALLHRSESSALHYIHFVERTPVKIEVANEFSRALLGIFSPREKYHE